MSETLLIVLVIILCIVALVIVVIIVRNVDLLKHCWSTISSKRGEEETSILYNKFSDGVFSPSNESEPCYETLSDNKSIAVAADLPLPNHKHHPTTNSANVSQSQPPIFPPDPKPTMLQQPGAASYQMTSSSHDIDHMTSNNQPVSALIDPTASINEPVVSCNSIPPVVEVVRRASATSISSDDSGLDQMTDMMISNLPRAPSSDSIDSTCSSLDLGATELDHGQLEARLFYEKTTQLLNVWLLQCCELRTDATEQSDVWVVIFLLPHPKPLWRTKMCSGTSNPQFHELFKQKVKDDMLRKLALFCQVYCRTDKNDTTQKAKLLGHTKVRLKDVALSEPNTLWLSLSGESLEQSETIVKRGDIQFSLSYLPNSERLTVVVGKVKRVLKDDNSLPQSCQIKAYLVQGPKKIAKKNTSARVPDSNGNMIFNESVIFTLPQRHANKVYLRLSVTEQSELHVATLGHVTVGSKCSDKAFGHWNQIFQHPGKQVAMWHPIRPKKFV